MLGWPVLVLSALALLVLLCLRAVRRTDRRG
jgi:hypothetical protein